MSNDAKPPAKKARMASNDGAEHTSTDDAEAFPLNDGVSDETMDEATDDADAFPLCAAAYLIFCAGTTS